MLVQEKTRLTCWPISHWTFMTSLVCKVRLYYSSASINQLFNFKNSFLQLLPRKVLWNVKFYLNQYFSQTSSHEIVRKNFKLTWENLNLYSKIKHLNPVYKKDIENLCRCQQSLSLVWVKKQTEQDLTLSPNLFFLGILDMVPSANMFSISIKWHSWFLKSWWRLLYFGHVQMPPAGKCWRQKTPFCLKLSTHAQKSVLSWSISISRILASIPVGICMCDTIHGSILCLFSFTIWMPGSVGNLTLFDFLQVFLFINWDINLPWFQLRKIK